MKMIWWEWETGTEEASRRRAIKEARRQTLVAALPSWRVRTRTHFSQTSRPLRHPSLANRPSHPKQIPSPLSPDQVPRGVRRKLAGSLPGAQQTSGEKLKSLGD